LSLKYRFYGAAYEGPLLHILGIGMHVSCMSEMRSNFPPRTVCMHLEFVMQYWREILPPREDSNSLKMYDSHKIFYGTLQGAHYFSASRATEGRIRYHVVIRMYSW